LVTVKTGALKALSISSLTLIPLGVIFYLALSSDTSLWAHFAQYVLPPVVGNTLLLMVCVAVGVLMIGVPLAWIIAVCEFPGRRFFSVGIGTAFSDASLRAGFCADGYFLSSQALFKVPFDFGLAPSYGCLIFGAAFGD